MALDALVGDLDGLDESLVIKVHLIDAGHAMVCVPFTQRATVIYDIPPVRGGDMEDGVMPGAGGDGRVLLQHFGDALEGAEG